MEQFVSAAAIKTPATPGKTSHHDATQTVVNAVPPKRQSKINFSKKRVTVAMNTADVDHHLMSMYKSPSHSFQKAIKKHLQEEREMPVNAPSNRITFKDVNTPNLGVRVLDIEIESKVETLNASLVEAFQLVEKVVWACKNPDGSGEINSTEEWNKYVNDWDQDILSRKGRIVQGVLEGIKRKLFGRNIDDVVVGAMNVWKIACHAENICYIDDQILRRLVHLTSCPMPADIAACCSDGTLHMENCKLLLAARYDRCLRLPFFLFLCWTCELTDFQQLRCNMDD
jgi:hypothetical protein